MEFTDEYKADKEFIKKKLKDLNEGQGYLFATIVVATFILLVVIVIAGAVILDTTDTPESRYVGEGTVDRIGSNSIIIDGKIYDNICERDLPDLIGIDDYVVIENGRCGDYKIILQKIGG